ncbi:nucleic acid-binding, OB-fold, replication protein A, OB domain protein [Tanacetum coccineum]
MMSLVKSFHVDLLRELGCPSPCGVHMRNRTKMSILIMLFAKHKIYIGCRACNFGVDPKTEDYKDEESGLVKKKIVGYICLRFYRVLDNTGSVSLTLFDRIANALLNKEANELVEKQLKGPPVSLLRRKLEMFIWKEELSNASSTKKKPIAPKIEKD